MATAFNTASQPASVEKVSLTWKPNGDVELVVSITNSAGVERARRTFTANAAGRVLDLSQTDIGPVPSNWASTLSAFSAKVDAAVAALAGAGRCDP